MSDERRFQRIQVHDSFVTGFFKPEPLICGRREGDITHGYRLIDPLPSSATVQNIQYDWSRQCFEIIIHDKSYDVVPEWEVIPYGKDIAYHNMVFRCVDVKKNLYELLP